MADNIPITQGSGATVATDQIGGLHYQRIKVSDGTADSENHWVIDAGGAGQVDVTANTAWSDPNTFIGLATVEIANDVTIGSALPAGTNAIGKLSANSGVDIGDVDVTSNTAWSDPNTFIGLVTVGNTVGTTITGNITVDQVDIVGTLTTITNDVSIDDGGNSITVDGNVGLLGNVTIESGTVSILGNVTVDQVDTVTAVTDITNPIALKGNITLEDSKTFIGLTTSVNAYKSSSTIHTWVGATSGFATVFTPPGSNRFFLQNLHVASMGDSNVEIRSGATTLIPFTALATQGGYSQHYGEDGLPSRAQDDAFVVHLNSAATLSVMANVRFAA